MDEFLEIYRQLGQKIKYSLKFYSMHILFLALKINQ